MAAILCDTIGHFIEEKINASKDGEVEIGRNELAEKFGCAPSQITYVLRTRFSPLRGYRIRSKRGGGGSVKIQRVDLHDSHDFEQMIKKELSKPMTMSCAEKLLDSLVHTQILGDAMAQMMLAAVTDDALHLVGEERLKVRTSILKQMLKSTVCIKMT